MGGVWLGGLRRWVDFCLVFWGGWRSVENLLPSVCTGNREE